MTGLALRVLVFCLVPSALTFRWVTNNDTALPSVAVLLTGLPERLFVRSLLENVVQVNANNGVAIHIFLSLMEPSPRGPRWAGASQESLWLYKENPLNYTVDPAIADLVGDPQSLLVHLCGLFRQSGAVHCQGGRENDTPLTLPDDEHHRNSITFYSPYKTHVGQSLLRRWRSVEGLWTIAKAVERAQGFSFQQVLVVRDDAYWAAPYSLNPVGFVNDPKILSTVPCMRSHGLNDKMLHLGRLAADAVLPAYSAWQQGDATLLTKCRSAEEFLGRLASVHGLHLRDAATPMALASFTDSGVPCFRKQDFKLPEGYHTCYGESANTDSYTRHFQDFSCNAMSNSFFTVLNTTQTASLYQAIKDVAGPERQSIMLTVTDLAMAGLTRNMLRSLVSAGEPAPFLVVGIEAGLCRELDDAKVGCLDLPLRQAQEAGETSHWGTSSYAEAVELKHAILTVVVLSGLSSGVLFTDPDIVFLRPPLDEIKTYANGKDVVFSVNNALAENPQSCADVARKYSVTGIASLRFAQTGSHVDINTGLLYLPSSVITSQLLLRTWSYLARASTREKRHYQQWSMVEAIKDMPSLKLAHMPCDRFVNGNVFWGHHSLLDPKSVFSVHANWMQSQLKRPCLEAVKLWDSRGDADKQTWWEELKKLPVQLKGSVIESCGNSV